MKVFLSENSMIPVKQNGVCLSLEDVNYAFDGGLYAEMLENRNFEAKEVRANGGTISLSPGGTFGWEPWPKGADVALKLKNDRPLFSENPHYMRVVAGEGGAGMRNLAYGGLSLRKNTEYLVSFFIRSYDYKDAAFIGLYAGGQSVDVKKVRIKNNGKWVRYEVKLKPKADIEGADLVFTLRKAGMVHANDFSMLPADAILGVFRRDIVDLLKEIKPKYLRFAGGHIPGSSLAPYAWKDSLFEPERRRQMWNPWAIANEPFYGQTLGLGFYECFRLAEYLGARPVPTIALPDLSPADAQFEACVQDAADLIEFANGEKDTMWGSLRDELGHSSPFNVTHLALEDGVSEEQLSAFAQRFKKLCPGIGLILPGESGDLCRMPVHAPKEDLLCMAKGDRVFSKKTFVELSALPKTASNGPETGTWEGALAEAAYLTSIEHNADMVPSESFTPLLARAGHAVRTPALIWMDAGRAFGTPSYYVQKIFSLYTGDLIVQAAPDDGRVVVSASEREGFTFVKLANISDAPLEAEIEGDFEFGQLTRVIRMEGELAACNTFAEPEKICASDIAPAAPRTAALPPHSFSVLVFRR